MMLTVADIATKCGVTKRTVYRWLGESHPDSYEWASVRDWLIALDRWDELVDMPTRPARKRSLDSDTVFALIEGGTSELSAAKHLGVNRKTVRRALGKAS